MKTKIYFSGEIVKTIILTILLLLTIFMFAVAIFALVNKEWWIVFMGMLLGLFFSVSSGDCRTGSFGQWKQPGRSSVNSLPMPLMN